MPNEREINLSIEYAERRRARLRANIAHHAQRTGECLRELRTINTDLARDRARLAAMQRSEASGQRSEIAID